MEKKLSQKISFNAQLSKYVLFVDIWYALYRNRIETKLIPQVPTFSNQIIFSSVIFLQQRLINYVSFFIFPIFYQFER